MFTQKSAIHTTILYPLLSLLCIFLLFLSCQNQEARSYSLEELENNEENVLGLYVAEQPAIQKLCQELGAMGREEIIEFLQKKDIGLFEASYGFHFLGNRYFVEDEFDKGMHYQYVAADQYLNPLAQLRIALLYYKPTAEIKGALPEGQGKDFAQDFAKSYHYLHLALNYSMLTMSEFADRTAIDDVNHYGRPLIDVFQKKDSTILGDFDVDAAAAKMKAYLPELESKFNTVYVKEELEG